MDRNVPRIRLVLACIAVGLVVAACSSGPGSTAADSGAGRPPADPGSSGQLASWVDEAFLQEMSGAHTLAEAAAMLYQRCDDPSVPDRVECRAAVQGRLEAAPVTLTDVGAPGCAALWADGGMVLKGADCVAAFQLVGPSGEPFDPATLPADGRMPQGGGIATGAVPPSGHSAVDETFLQQVSGVHSLEQAAAVLYARCGDDPSVPDPAECGAAVQGRLEVAPVTLTDVGAPGCAARWEGT
jgi:hypothetical protein